jgi:hypothetical protein
MANNSRQVDQGNSASTFPPPSLTLLSVHNRFGDSSGHRLFLPIWQGRARVAQAQAPIGTEDKRFLHQLVTQLKSRREFSRRLNLGG